MVSRDATPTAPGSLAAGRREGLRRRAVSAGALVLLVASHASAVAGERATARQWLASMAHAVVKTSYRGTFVYRSGKRLESVQIVRRNDENGMRERLLALTGLPTEVLRDERKVICILPRSQAAAKPEVLQSVARPRDLRREGVLLGRSDLDTHYEIVMRPDHGRVAGRETVELEVKPRDDYRYGYLLSLDSETALPLGSRLVSHDGEVLEEILYTDIDLESEITDEMLSPNHKDAVVVSQSSLDREQQPKTVGEPGWQATWLPPGFALEAQLGAPGGGSTGAYSGKRHLVYSDGVATVSVFIEPLPDGGDALGGSSAMGATHAFATRRGDRQIISVGRVPPATVEKVARHVRPQ